MDEAEALACRRGGNSTVMNRLVPELLAQMDGFEKFDGHVIVIFATNRPYDLDPAFLRPGRLPNHCYIPLPDLEMVYERQRIFNQVADAAERIDTQAVMEAEDRMNARREVMQEDSDALDDVLRAGRIQEEMPGETAEFTRLVRDARLKQATASRADSLTGEAPAPPVYG